LTQHSVFTSAISSDVEQRIDIRARLAIGTARHLKLKGCCSPARKLGLIP